MFKNLGMCIGFVGLALFLFGAGGSVQFVSPNDNPVVDLLELGAIAGIITALLVAILTFSINREFDSTGAWIMAAGVFLFIQGAAVGLNAYFDNSEPSVRTFLVNNVDSRGGRRGTTYYAMIRSWWNPTQYIPLAVSKSLHDQLVPRKSHIDVAVHQGAFNMPYFGKVTINPNNEPQESMLEYYDGN